MTDYMARPGLNLPPTSRQDIISALLNDYGNSFEGGDSSPYSYSPIPTPKDLPPTPPAKERKFGDDKPLPAVGRMSMRFQLRVDEPASPTFSNESRSSSESSPTSIVSRRLTRNSKPPSLKLTKSNGSTAIVPPTPSLPLQSSPAPSPRPKEREKSLPPPPPPRSERRQQQSTMGNTSSAERPQKSSVQSPEPETATPVKRKPVPIAKFTSLAQLGGGPRGGKGGPLPPAPRARKQSVEDEKELGSNGRSASAVEAPRTRRSSDDDAEEQANKSRSLSAIETRAADARSPKPPPKPSPRPSILDQLSSRAMSPAANRLPPTPDENPLPAPPPVKRVPVGLPSNPRAKAAQHTKGKSSTGFDWMKSSKAAPEIRSPLVETITPDPTPSPRRTEEHQQTQDASPVSPMRDDGDRRPFSFEGGPPAAPPKDGRKPVPTPAPVKADSPVSPIKIENFPPMPRTPSQATRAIASLSSELQSQQQQSSVLSAAANNPRIPFAFANLPSQQRLHEEEDSEPPTPPAVVPRPQQPFAAPPPVAQPRPQQQQISTAPPPAQSRPQQQPSAAPLKNVTPKIEVPTSPTPFTSLTRQFVSRPAAPLMTKHLTCYSHHSNYVWSKNTFQPMACMVCKENDRERKWACTWCYLRVCLACSAELLKTPNRDLKALIEKRGVDIEIDGEDRELEAEMERALARKEDMKRHDSGTGAGVGTPTIAVWKAEDDVQDFS